MTEPLSFKIIHTVTDCSTCPSRRHDQDYGDVCFHWDDDPIVGRKLYNENCDGLTESCPIIEWTKK